MGDTYQRLFGSARSLDPGQWTVDKDITAKAIVCCKRCGALDFIADGHEIQRDGRMIPAWHCPTATCGEVSWIWLDQWSPS